VGIREDHASGKSTNGRHELQRALADLKEHHADGLVVAKLDRLSRSLADFANLLETATKQDWALVALDFDLDTTTPAGELVANVLAAVAQWERRVIGVRTRESLAVKKAQGVRLGKPRQIPPEVENHIVELRQAGKSFEQIADEVRLA
jgi:DNA invertase Pin-like site-specific DNA recombinase